MGEDRLCIRVSWIHLGREAVDISITLLSPPVFVYIYACKYNRRRRLRSSRGRSPARGIPPNLYTALLYPIRACHYFRLMEFALRGDRRWNGPLRHRKTFARPLKAIIYLKARTTSDIYQTIVSINRKGHTYVCARNQWIFARQQITRVLLLPILFAYMYLFMRDREETTYVIFAVF